MRIAIVGNSGSGKSTFSEWLANRLKLPVLHVDKLLWLPGWKQRAEPEVSQELDAFQKQSSWIVDGVGTRAQLETRLAQANVKILIDTPVEICRTNALRRADAQSEAANPYINANLRYQDVMDLQMQVIDQFEKKWLLWLRPRALAENWIVYGHYAEAYVDSRWQHVKQSDGV
jgi:adenylate kinase family enzyme